MAIHTAVLSTTFSDLTAANFREWTQAVDSAFSIGGWVQTSDTGQVNLATLAPQGSVSFKSGYKIWRMDDALQSTAPVYLRVDYGSGAASGKPGLWFTLGTGTDGAGVITGELLPVTQLSGAGNSTVSTIPTIYFSSDTSRVVLLCQSGEARLFFSIERTKDVTGSDTATGVHILCETKTSAIFSKSLTIQVNRTVRFTDNTLPSSSRLGAFVPSGATWGGDANMIGVCPVRFFEGGPSNPCTNLMVYLNGDTAAAGQVPVLVYGTSRNYRAMGTTLIDTVVVNAASTFMFLWE